MPIQTIHMYKGQEVQIARGEMRRVKKFKLTGSTELANKLIERKENEDLYNMLGQNPIANPVKVLDDLIKAYKPDADVSEYIKPEINQFAMLLEENPELPQIIAKYMQDKTEITQELEGEEGAGTIPQ